MTLSLRMDHSPESPSAACVATAASRPDLTGLKGFSAWFRWSLVLVMILGVSLRVAYIAHEIYNPDEQTAQAVVRGLSFPDQWDTNWAKNDVSEIFHYNQYNFSSYHYLLYFWKSLIAVFAPDKVHHLGALRTLNGLLGLVFMLAVALAMRKSIGEIAGISAALAGAIIPLLVQDAHYLRCEAMLTTGVAILIWSATWQEPLRPWWLLLFNGMIAGWLVAAKATMVLALPLLVLLLIPARSPNEKPWRLFCGQTGLISLGVALGFVLGVPYGVAQPQLYLSGLAKLAAEYGHTPWPPYTSPDLAPSIGVALDYMQSTLGWGFWLVTAFGSIGKIRACGWWRTTIMVLPLAAAFAVFGGHAYFSERSYSPFFPIVVLLFGAGVQFCIGAIVSFLGKLQSYRAALVVVLLSTTLALPSFYSWQIVAHGFSGREQREKDAALTRMKGSLSGKVMVIIGSRFLASDNRAITAALERKEPVLAVINDSYDSVTPRTLATLQGTFDARLLGVRESLFPDIPTCTLHTFISPRLWLLYIPPK